MARLIFKREQPAFHYDADIERMQRVLASNGDEASRNDLIACWEDYSDSYCAGWLMLPNDDQDLLDILLRKLTEE